MKKYSLEAIAFQINNSLGRDISSVITKAFQYRDSLDYSKVEEKNRAKYRQEKMLDYCVTTLFTDLGKAIKKGCGLEVKRFLYPSIPCGLFMTMFGYKEEIETFIMARQHGFIPPDNTINIAKQADELSKLLSSSVDLESSRINSKPAKFKIILVFDYLISFCLHDFISPSVSEELTPDEITAILLHEIGHAFSFAEHASDTYFRMYDIQERFKNINKNLLENQDNKEIVSAIKNSIIPMINKIYNIPKFILNMLESVSSNMEDALEYKLNNTTDLNIGENYYLSLQKKILTILINMLLMILGTLQLARLSRFFISTLLHFENKNINTSNKYSDVSESMINLISIESRADEFVVRHGYGSYLASGLGKLHDISNYFNLDKNLKALNDNVKDNLTFVECSKILSIFATLFRLDNESKSQILDYILNTPDLNRLKYDTEISRIQRMLVNTRTVFKNTFPPEQLTYWILEYEKIQKALDDAKSKPRNSKFASFMKTMQEILIINVTDFEKQANKYKEFFTQLEELINNEFYYNAAKFRQLANLIK